MQRARLRSDKLNNGGGGGGGGGAGAGEPVPRGAAGAAGAAGGVRAITDAAPVGGTGSAGGAGAAPAASGGAVAAGSAGATTPMGSAPALVRHRLHAPLLHAVWPTAAIALGYAAGCRLCSASPLQDMAAHWQWVAGHALRLVGA